MYVENMYMYLHTFFSNFLKHKSTIFDFCKKQDHLKQLSGNYMCNNTCIARSAVARQGRSFFLHAFICLCLYELCTLASVQIT